MRRRNLTPESLLDAATSIADLSGFESLTLAGLAQRLSVRPPSLYKHIAGLEELRRALSMRGLREVNLRLQQATVGKTREEALLALASAYWQFARERPGLYVASLRPAQPGEKEIATANDMLLRTVHAVLAGYRIEGDDVLHATRGLRSIIHGFVSLDVAGGFRLKRDLEESLSRLLNAFARDLADRGRSVEPIRSPQ